MLGAEEQAVVWEDGSTTRVEWQPGNGTRYQLVIVQLPDLEVPGMPVDGGILVVEGPTPRAEHAAYFNLTGLLHYSYVQSKMGYRSFIDASEVSRVLGTILGRSFVVKTNARGESIDESVLFGVDDVEA
jgi:hypothetical protein